MKKWLSLILVLCMMLPMVAMGETAAKAQLTEVTFTPGTLPAGAEEMQSVFGQIMDVLGISVLSQPEDDYNKVDLLLGGQSAVSFATYLKDGNLNVLSEIFGDKPMAFTEEEMTTLLSDVMSSDGTPMGDAMKDQMLAGVKVLFGGDISGTGFEAEIEAMVEQLFPAVMKAAEDLTPYLEKAEMVEGDFVVSDTVKGTQAAVIRLNAADLRDITKKFGESLGTVEFFKKQLEAQENGKSLEDIFAEAEKEIPESTQAECSVIMDAEGEVLCISLLVKTDDSDFDLSVIPDMAEEKFVVQAIMDGKEKVAMTFGIDGDTLHIKVESFILNDAWQSEGSFGMDITVKEEGTTTEVTMAFLYEDAMILTVNVKTSEVEKAALPDVSGAVHMAALSAEESEAIGQEYMQNAMVVLQNAVMKLPADLQSMLFTLMQ
jgi:hypothetical protein